MITCILGLTACDSEITTLSEFEQDKVFYAKERAVNSVIPLLIDFSSEEGYAQRTQMNAYTVEEMEYVLLSSQQFEIDGNAFRTAVNSFMTTLETTGKLTIGSVEEATAVIDGKQIIVQVPMKGEKKNAEAEIIFSNDMFLKMESGALNPTATMGDMMNRAALNTLIGMSVVFAVLILIIGVISCFQYISKIQDFFSKKKKTEPVETGVDNALAQIVNQEEADTDDLELIAVIAAAIAASEGATTTDGFVVRSIRKRK